MKRKLFKTMFSVALAVCLMGNTVSASELGTTETEEVSEPVMEDSEADTLDVSAGDAAQESAVEEYTEEIPVEGATTGLTYTVEGDTITITGESECWTSGSEIIQAIRNAKNVVFKKCKIKGSMKEAFEQCSNLQSIDLSGLDTSQVTNMSRMFIWCSNLTSLNVSGFDTSKVTDMCWMFWGCESLTSLDVSGFDTSQVTDMSQMFGGCSKLISLDVSGFDTSQVTNMSQMFSGCSKLTSLDVSGFNTSKVTNMCQMFGYYVKLGTIEGCSSLTSLDVSGFDTSKVTNMGGMFSGCSKLASLNVSGFDTSKVTDMSQMFCECSKLASLNVSSFDTSKVTVMGSMFASCSSLTNLYVNGFNTSKVTDMWGMFSGCSSLTALDVSGFDTSKVIDMRYMFKNCSNLTSLDVSGLNTSQVTNMNGMFENCSGLTSLDVTGFDTSKVESLQIDYGSFIISDGMFQNCSNLKTLDLSSFDLGKVSAEDEGLQKMLTGCSLKELRTPKALPAGCSIPLGRDYRAQDGVITDVLTSEFAHTTLTLYNVVEPFTDVRNGAWYVSAVQYVYENGIMTGKTATTFAPNDNLTRAEFATVLYSQAGKPAVDYRPIFKDVAQGAWYTSPVLWAYDNRIVSGYANGSFGTSDKITREQLALMMYKYAQTKGYDTTVDDSILSSFSDEADISSWARKAIQWAASHGIMSGKGKGVDGKPMLDPKGNATRAECAAMIKKLFTME